MMVTFTSWSHIHKEKRRDKKGREGLWQGLGIYFLTLVLSSLPTLGYVSQ